MGRRRGAARLDDPSQDDKTTCPGILAVSKAPQDRTRSEREPSEGSRRRGKGSTVAARVGDDQEHAVRTAVTSLQGELALERLGIHHDCLRLHRQPPAAPADHRVPGSELAIAG
jgi:hypothetical protein